MIRYFIEGIDFSVPRPILTKRWLREVIRQERRSLNALTYIFCSDIYLHQLNIDYLNHDTLTDVITFDYSEGVAEIEGEVYISIDRVSENAQGLNAPFEVELKRVMVHGLLHLIGYHDKDRGHKNQMTLKEDTYLTQHFKK